MTSSRYALYTSDFREQSERKFFFDSREKNDVIGRGGGWTLKTIDDEGGEDS